MKARVAMALLAVLSPTVTSAGDWYVDAHHPNCGSGTGGPDDPFCTIGEAIAAANDADTIHVAPGHYDEALAIDKDLIVIGTGGCSVTSISKYSGRPVTIGPGAVVTLRGLTMTGGEASPGGGILISGATLLMEDCAVLNNRTPILCVGMGGGIAAMDSCVWIVNSRIRGNYNAGDWWNSAGFGSGIYASGGSVELLNCIISDNAGYTQGCAIYASGTDLRARGCTVTRNTAYSCYCGETGAIEADDGSLTNSIVWGNVADHAIGGPLSVTYCDVEGGFPGAGNIDFPPLFVDPGNGDFRLRQHPCQDGVFNPCVDAGDPTSPIDVRWSTRSDWGRDVGVVDLGFHGSIPGAAVRFRNAGANPASYDALTLPVIGSTYTATVDLATTGHDFAWLVCYLSPAWFTVGGGGERVLLVNVFDPGGEQLQLPPLSGPVATFHVPVPDDPCFAGLELFTQAVHLGGLPTFDLSNAQDLRLGF